MKITDVKVYSLKTHSVFVQVLTNEGISGIGECSPMNLKVISGIVENVLKPCIIGENPLEIEKLWNKMFFSTYKLGVMGAQMEAIAGVDIALWDILGKVTNLPVYTLLGGTHCEKVKMYASIGGGFAMTPDEMVAKVEDAYNDGFRAFKIRMDWGAYRQDANPNKDFEMFKKVRKFLGDDIQLSFDANNGYSVKTAIRQGKRFQEYGIFQFEEPIAQYDYDGYKTVCRALDMPISAGEHEYTRWQFKDLIENAGVDAIQPDVIKCGGITEMKKIAMLGELYNKHLIPHQTQPTIGGIASLSVCCTTINFNIAHEMQYGRWNVGEASEDPLTYMDELFEEPLKFKDGYIYLPEKPGLGLVLNEERLKDLIV